MRERLEEAFGWLLGMFLLGAMMTAGWFGILGVGVLLGRANSWRLMTETWDILLTAIVVVVSVFSWLASLIPAWCIWMIVLFWAIHFVRQLIQEAVREEFIRWTARQAARSIEKD